MMLKSRNLNFLFDVSINQVFFNIWPLMVSYLIDTTSTESYMRKHESDCAFANVCAYAQFWVSSQFMVKLIF